MRKTLSVLLFSSLLSTTAYAEEQPFRNWSLGLGAGPTIGAGFSGRYDWESGWGLQATALPYITKNEGFVLEGVTGLYTIDRNKHGSIYLSLGVVGWHRLITSYDWPVSDGKLDANGNPLPAPAANPTVTQAWSHGFATGPGLGFRFKFFENYSFSFDLPAAFVFEVKDSKVTFDSFKPWPNVALMYSF